MATKDTTIHKVIAGLSIVLLGIFAVYYLTSSSSDTSPDIGQGSTESSPQKKPSQGTTKQEATKRFSKPQLTQDKAKAPVNNNNERKKDNKVSVGSSFSWKYFVPGEAARPVIGTVLGGLISLAGALYYYYAFHKASLSGYAAVGRLLKNNLTETFLAVIGVLLSAFLGYWCGKLWDTTMFVVIGSTFFISLGTLYCADQHNFFTTHVIAGILIGISAFTYTSYGKWDANGSLPSDAINLFTINSWTKDNIWAYITSFLDKKEMSTIGVLIIFSALIYAITDSSHVGRWEFLTFCLAAIVVATLTIKVGQLMNSWCPGEGTLLAGVMWAAILSARYAAIQQTGKGNIVSLADLGDPCNRYWFASLVCVLVLGYLYDIKFKPDVQQWLNPYIGQWENISRRVVWGARVVVWGVPLVTIISILGYVTPILLVGIVVAVIGGLGYLLYHYVTKMWGKVANNIPASWAAKASWVQGEISTYKTNYPWIGSIVMGGIGVGIGLLVIARSTHSEWYSVNNDDNTCQLYSLAHKEAIAIGIGSAVAVGPAWRAGINPLLSWETFMPILGALLTVEVQHTWQRWQVKRAKVKSADIHA